MRGTRIRRDSEDLTLYLHTLCSLILQFTVSVHLLSPPIIFDQSLTLPIVWAAIAHYVLLSTFPQFNHFSLFVFFFARLETLQGDYLAQNESHRFSTSVIIIKERHDNKPFPLSSRQPLLLKQPKSLKLLSHLVPNLPAFLISHNYPLPTTLIFVFRESIPKVAVRGSFGLVQAPGGRLEVRQPSFHFPLFFPPRHHDTAEERLGMLMDKERFGKSGQEGRITWG